MVRIACMPVPLKSRNKRSGAPALEPPRFMPHLPVLSKSQIDHLGDRLRAGSLNENDLRTLDAYRRSFSEAYETIVGVLRERLLLEPTGRPAKSTSSILEKLHRESIRLSQMQDIAGCRVVVADTTRQMSVATSICNTFAKTTLTDRRTNPSHGYRAVHVIIQHLDKLIEIQIRSILQHLWAELSEKLSDKDPGIKYGKGKVETQQALIKISDFIKNIEENEIKVLNLQKWNPADNELLQLQGIHIKSKLAKILSKAISQEAKGD